MKFVTRYRILVIGLTALVATEGFLRIAFGLGNPPLFQKDSVTGYRFKPNQEIIRFDKRMEFNQYSQRSEPIALEKPKETIRILMVGDSVLNGGNPIDQSQTITERIETKIQAPGHSVEVLNASASSWGIGNQLGYLQKFGTLHSDIVILLISSHNLSQSTSTSDRVGKNPFYPDHPPLFAIQEVISRYILPNIQEAIRTDQSSINSTSSLTNTKTKIERTNASSEVDQQFQQNMKLLKKSISLVQNQKVPVDVLFIPNRQDLIPTVVAPNHKPKFLQFLKTIGIPLLDVHQTWSTLPAITVSNYFRDPKHLTAVGNEAVANFVFRQLCLNHQIQNCSGKRQALGN
jgi:hypothetical protein